nr:MAG TPA: hypothetical protein [Caudoviricetes sp.]
MVLKLVGKRLNWIRSKRKHLTFLILNKKELNMSPFVGMSFSQT